MRPDETVDELRDYNLSIIQPVDGYRFSLDPLLLCDFVSHHRACSVMDLGTGTGVITLILARRMEGASLFGMELQREVAGIAERNVQANSLADRISIIPDDITSARKYFPVSSFDLVVSNPPYRKQGTGRISPKAGRDIARHESTCSLADFLAVAKYLVKPSGRICFIYHPSRLFDFIVEAAALKLKPIRLRMVHGNKSAEARMFMMELMKDSAADLTILPPLYVNDVEA